MRWQQDKMVVYCAAICIALAMAAPAVAEVTAQQVRNGIARAITNLSAQQRASGEFPGMGQPGGPTAIVTLSLLHAGVASDDPGIVRAIAYLNTVPNRHTYVVSLKAQVFAIADPIKYRKPLQSAMRWLVQTQHADGVWYYGTSASGGDNSNTQFALLGLHEAANAGVKVPRSVWIRSAKHFRTTQGRNGGWGYRRRETSYGSMTAAGLASMYICGQEMHAAANRPFTDGVYTGCGKYRQNLTVAKGMQWMSTQFSVTQNPGQGARWYYYYMYGMERCGMIAGVQKFGRHDWYRQGAAALIKRQRVDGSWSRQSYDTAMGLLFLAKGNRPVIMQKLNTPDAAGRNVHALKNLCGFLGDKLGKHTAWQMADMDASLKELRASPLLLITGHTFPKFSPEQIERLKEYVESGGTLFFEGCCGSKEFNTGFRTFAASVWPAYKLRPLPKSHPVFRSYYKLDKTDGLEGLDTGCRTGVFFSPTAITALWEIQDEPILSDRAFRLGTNLAAYATGREQLPDKLDVVDLTPSAKPKERTTEVPRGAIRLARLKHQGDYSADPLVLNKLAEQLRTQANMNVVPRSRHLAATDPALYEYPVLFLNGHFKFDLSTAETAALRDYLTKGGTLVISACCGKKAFDTSVRKLAKAVLPNAPLTALKPDHALYTGKAGVTLGELKYRPLLAKELGKRGTSLPPIEEATLDGRAAILYSPLDWCCGFEGDTPYSCRGYIDADAKRLGLAIMLYAISY